jgi:site-specific recombinase XerD
MTEDMQVRNLSPHTQASYLQQVSLFARHFGKSPDALTPEHIRTYQIYLTNEKKLAAGSIHIAVAALRFLYKITLKREWTFADVLPLPKKPQKLPVVLSPEEVVHFLGCVACRKQRVILTACYAAGLRVSEAVRLNAGAIDSKRMVISADRILRGASHMGTGSSPEPSLKIPGIIISLIFIEQRKLVFRATPLQN